VTFELRHALGDEVAEVRRAEDVEAIAVERVEVIAVRLHEVGLVDALLLIVRPGVVDALLSATTAAAVATGARGRIRTTILEAKPVARVVDVGEHLLGHEALEIGLEIVAARVLVELGRRRLNMVRRCVRIRAACGEDEDEQCEATHVASSQQDHCQR
jgi:hypothetical protein